MCNLGAEEATKIWGGKICYQDIFVWRNYNPMEWLWNLGGGGQAPLLPPLLSLPCVQQSTGCFPNHAIGFVILGRPPFLCYPPMVAKGDKTNHGWENTL